MVTYLHIKGERLEKKNQSTLPSFLMRVCRKYLDLIGWTLLGIFLSWKGLLDSLFINNCIAVAQSDLRVPQYKDKAVLVPDNEPRNREVIKQIEKAIDEDYRIVVWIDHVRQKDINDMILSGMDAAEITKCIHTNTFQGLSAKIELQKWKKI